MVYMALSGSMRGFNRSWMDLLTKRFTKCVEGNRGIRGEYIELYWGCSYKWE